MPPQLPIPLELRGRPFRLEEARTLGVARKVLRGRRFRRLRRGVYVEASAHDDHETEVDAVLALMPGATLSHQTSALLRGLPVLSDRMVHVTVPRSVRPPALVGVCSHRAAISPVIVDGRSVTAPVDNFVELAEHLPLVDLVVVGDAILRRSMATLAELAGATSRSRRRAPRALTRRAAGLVRVGVDSRMETRVRLLIVLAGMPEPVPGFVIRDANGEWIAQVDLAYPAQRIAIEYHGDVHRLSRGQWRSDVTKAELLRSLGWTVIILTADDLDGRPERTLDRVRSALLAANHPQVPDSLDDEWRKHLTPAWARDRVPPTD